MKCGDLIAKRMIQGYPRDRRNQAGRIGNNTVSRGKQGKKQEASRKDNKILNIKRTQDEEKRQ